MTTTSGTDAAPTSAAPIEGAASTSADAVDVEGLKAAAAELAALKADIAKGKQADREAKRRAQEEAEKAGELAKALEAAKARLAELEPLEPLAGKWRAHEQAEAKRLDDEAATLPEAVRNLYARASDLDGKREILAAFRATAPASSTAALKGTPPSIGAPPTVTAVDVEEAIKDPSGKKLAEIKSRDPSAVAAFFKSALGGRSNKTSSLGVARFMSPAKAPNT